MKTCSIEFEDSNKSVDLTGCDDCSECNGEGGFWVGWPEEEWETCENCNGTGVDSSDYNAAMWTAYHDDLDNRAGLERHHDETRKSVKLSGIPDELKDYAQWVVWRYEQYKGEKKPRKIPYCPMTGKKTRTMAIDSGNWGTIEQAVQAVKTFKGRFHGIGFVFSQEDPFVGIDIDHCMTEGAPSALAKEIIEKLQSFTEVSPSGNGLHIIIKGKKPGTRCKRRLDENQEIEVYDKDRFFIVTGNWVADTSALVNQDQQAFEEIYHKYIEEEANKRSSENPKIER